MSVSCWYTGIEVVDGPSDGSNMAVHTVEHIVPVDSHLFTALKGCGALYRRNTVPACGYVNWSLGSAPLPVKFAVRDRLRQELYGTEDLRGVTKRATWTRAVQSLCYKVITEEEGRYRLLDKRIHHNPLVVPDKGVRLWSLDNPHHPITPAILQTRDELLAELRQLTADRVRHRFEVDATPEIAEAIEQDLFRHEGPKARNHR